MSEIGHIPVAAAGLCLYKINRKGELIGCEPVIFDDGLPAVDTTLRRARISGHVKVSGETDGPLPDWFADILNQECDIIGNVELDRASYRSLKNHWMRCRIRRN